MSKKNNMVKLDNDTNDQIMRILNEPANYNMLSELNKTYDDFHKRVKEIEHYIDEINKDINLEETKK